MKLAPSPFPPAVAKALSRYLDSKQGRHCQLSTTGKASQPESRTVGIRFDQKLGFLFCISHIAAPKWRHLERLPKVAGCIYDPQVNLQLRWRASVEIVSQDTRSAEKQKFRQRAWEVYPPRYQKFYWDAWQKKHKRDLADRKKVCPDFGVIVLKPSIWYVDAVAGFHWIVRRRLFKRTGTAWKKIYEGYALGKKEYGKLRQSQYHF